MRTGEWAGAAAIYSAARVRLSEPSLFSNNVKYIAQEWTRDASASGAAGVTAAMNELMSLFPGDRNVTDMGLQTLRRMVAADVEANAFESAEGTIRVASSFLTQQEAGSLTVTLYSRRGERAIDTGDWPEALRSYAEGLAIMPDAEELSRNVPFVFQEWSREALDTGGASQLADEILRMQEILPEAPSLPGVLESVVGREVSERVENNDPQAALDLIGEIATVLPDDLTVKLKVLAYDSWARSTGEAGNWGHAVRIYDLGLLDVPQNRLLENNRHYAESKL